MDVLKLDQDAESMLDYSLALYHFRGYVGGFEDLMKYLAVLSFERVLIQNGLKLEEFKNMNPRDVSVPQIIRSFEKIKKIDRAKASKLRRLWDFRCSIMHAGSLMSKEQTDLGTREILRFLCEEARRNFDEDLRSKTFEDISTFGKGWPRVAKEYKKIVDSDFDNFAILYEKCPALQLQVGRRLPLERGLLPEQISGFIPNTGGIWLPWVIKKTPSKRAHIHRASLGIAFTPTNVRIGLDFGNKAHKSRERYYELLLREELKNELDRLRSSSREYGFCDTFWYYHVRNTQPLQWYFDLDPKKKREIEEAIEETRRLEGKPLTANKFLIGRVMERKSEKFSNVLENIVEDAAKTIDELYPILAKIEMRF